MLSNSEEVVYVRTMTSVWECAALCLFRDSDHFDFVLLLLACIQLGRNSVVDLEATPLFILK